MTAERTTIHTRERRFLLPSAGALEELLRARLAPVQYVPGRDESVITTVYVDTEEGTWSRGRSRTKFRCRNYGDPAVWWFEMKRRVGTVVDKWRHPATPEKLAGVLSGAARGPALRPLVGEAPLLPLVTVRYRRIAWDWETMRVTLDRDVRFLAPAFADPLAAGEPAGGLREAVVEVKRDGRVPAWLAAPLAGRRARQFSKSRRALAALGRSWTSAAR